MSNMVSPVAAELLTLMAEEVSFPADWETSGLWLTSAQELAEYLARQRQSQGEVDLYDAAALVGIGGLLVEMAKREREAAAITASFSGREGGAA